MMKKILIVLIFLLLIFPNYTCAYNYTNYELGKLEQGSVKLVYEDTTINTYKAYDANYILASDLKALGCSINYSPANRSISISAPTLIQTLPDTSINLISQPFSLYNGTVTLENFNTQSITCNNHILIPIAALGTWGTLSVVDDTCYFSPTSSVPVSTTQNSITNLSDYDLNVSIVDIYWKNEALLVPSNYTLAPNETLERPISNTDKDAIYISTLVQSADGQFYTYTTTSQFGQLNVPLMKKYTYLSTHPVIKNYGDAIGADATMHAEAFVNGKNLSSPTPYLVWTNIESQRTYIFQGSKNNWTLIKTFICSTGKDHTPTPKGTFALTRKVPSFGQNKGYCCKYAFGFIGTTYLYHSIIFDKSGTYLLENKGVLGKKASQGCIRFSVENAKWFYDTLLPKTTVYIN
ncbi:MAG: L,D-transpeptidase [Cellulosilyticum sp.]|nr:L,D-transpeptidase [Cellulosilyticum sp.]